MYDVLHDLRDRIVPNSFKLCRMMELEMSRAGPENLRGMDCLYYLG